MGLELKVDAACFKIWVVVRRLLSRGWSLIAAGFLKKRGNRRGLKSRKGPRDSWGDLDFSWRAGGRRRVFLGESDLWVMGDFTQGLGIWS
ncbi:hypothetical protein EUGRSUZ_A01136 [Eucalyptus grandis]|uniref:Uncharacterized protein n=2 Tax=Eucalyptus grandis TaxID=71139 RepID=A0ACC3M366_EUCGR|nr:hypothetical protein EUGRSUZ_A01136 [Eucalyptus grandis]